MLLYVTFSCGLTQGFQVSFGDFRFCVLLGSLGPPRLLWVCLSETFSEMKQDREFIHFWAKMLNCLFLDSFPARFLFFPPFLGMSFDVIWFLTFEETTTLLWLGFTERLSQQFSCFLLIVRLVTTQFRSIFSLPPFPFLILLDFVFTLVSQFLLDLGLIQGSRRIISRYVYDYVHGQHFLRSSSSQYYAYFCLFYAQYTF